MKYTGQVQETYKTPVLGIIHNAKGLFPFYSVERTWRETIRLLSERYSTILFPVDCFEVPCHTAEFHQFIKQVDLLILLAPYYVIDRNVKDTPAIVYGLGSLQKGGHWLYRNQDSFRTGDVLILNCHACESILESIIKNEPFHTCIMPPPIDDHIFFPRANKQEIKKCYNIPQESLILIYSGRFNLQKNVHLLLSILRLLRQSHDAHLVLLGFFDNFYIPEFSDSPPPDAEDEFMTLLDKFGLSNNVTLIEHQKDPKLVAEILSAADIGINLSTLINENFGLSVVEMQLCGLPVVCSDWGGMRDTVSHGKTGFLVDTILSRFGPRVNVDQCLHYLKLLADEDKFREALSTYAAKEAQKFTLPFMIDQFCSVIKNTWERSIECRKVNIKFHPTMKSFYDFLALNYDNSRETIWDHLYPSLDFAHYRLIVSQLATYSSTDVIWTKKSQIAKAFDWSVDKDNQFVSLDVKWNRNFELAHFDITELEMDVLKCIDSGERLVSILSSNWREPLLLKTLGNLTHKGLIMPRSWRIDDKATSIL